MRKILHGIGLAIALAALAPGHAFANCEGSNRISEPNASCLTAEWTNDAKDGFPRIFLKNKCHFFGTMSTLTVFENDNTETINVSTSTAHLGSQKSDVSSVHCCKDLEGRFCNRTDKLTDSFCSTQFGHSSAYSMGCRASSATADTEDEECSITADCPDGAGGTVSSTLAVDMALTTAIVLCSGDGTIAGNTDSC